VTMKKAELEKRMGKQITNRLQQSAPRGGPEVTAPPDRRAQREIERAAGLVPFAVKLHGGLVQELLELAHARQEPMNQLVDRLLRAGLTHQQEQA
jgi:hypothetical protein